MRRAVLAAALLCAASCGGTPVAPSPAAAPPAARAVTLDSGDYTLAITFSREGIATCENGICRSISFCTGSPAPATATFDVTLARSGSMATVRVPGSTASLILELTVASYSVTGGISGSARDSQGVTIAASGGVSGGAPADPAYAVAGNIDGQMTVPGGSCSNNGHAWSLARR